MKERLYFSKPGIVCAAGCGAEEFWASLTGANNGGLVRVVSASGEEFFAGRIEDSRLSPTGARYDMRIIRIEDAALEQIAPVVARARAKYGSDRIAVCIGSCDNGSELSVAAHREYFSAGAFPQGYSLEIQGADYPATYAREKFALEGPSYVFATACSSSASAIAMAADLIRAGIADAAIVGGADVASDTVLLGFNALEAVSPKKTNPFSKNRSGITLGEGAAFFVLAKDRDVVQDGGEVCAEFLGAGESCDASHMTAPREDGSGALCAMRAALQDAGLSPGQIDYVNLHGTGTRLNDAMEARAMQQCFGGNCAARSMPYASSTKPVTGHTLGASSAVELAACALAIVNNDGKDASRIRLPVHVYDGEYDETIPPLNLVTEGMSAASEIKICMSNSFGFGGCNVSLIIGKSAVK